MNKPNPILHPAKMKCACLFLLILIGCKSQNNPAYQTVDPTIPQTIEKANLSQPTPSKITKGAIRLKVGVVSIEAHKVTANILEIAAIGPNFTSVAPEKGKSILLANKAGYELEEAREYLVEVFLNNEDSYRGSLIKLVGKTKNEQ
ncbi:MAG: hypothetical protein AAGA66_12100 [Bacteroidota bacterium]